jgi:hypothetical protein
MGERLPVEPLYRGVVVPQAGRPRATVYATKIMVARVCDGYRMTTKKGIGRSEKYQKYGSSYS